MINQWIYNRVTSSTNIIAIIGTNCFPSLTDYQNIPAVTYDFLSQGTNKIVKSPIITIRNYETTQDKAMTLNNLLYNLFDGTTQVIRENSTVANVKIEGVSIVNNIPAVFDFQNKIWVSNLDIQVYYI